ncbi:hypothetical protein MTQ12_13620 [Brevibacterium sp. R8603A2]|uniref:hypothetical protein n=1 Tax=Brevibacterium sp. R8603A2 TaxID=2929779 RepID=UPI001FF8A062|nr:hypothetical protein [Brevibacterium sp. R8603A2]MCK1804075.1 hypothetical protein [Brevibacterium sp. R8603A2]
MSDGRSRRRLVVVPGREHPTHHESYKSGATVRLGDHYAYLSKADCYRLADQLVDLAERFEDGDR